MINVSELSDIDFLKRMKETMGEYSFVRLINITSDGCPSELGLKEECNSRECGECFYNSIKLK